MTSTSSGSHCEGQADEREREEPFFSGNLRICKDQSRPQCSDSD